MYGERNLRAHGGPDFAEIAALGLFPPDILDFSVNVNPYGPTDSVVRAARGAALDRYADPTGACARQRLASSLGIRADEIALGNGAAPLLWTLGAMLASHQRPALIVEPTFSEYAAAVRARRGVVKAWHASEANGFDVDLEQVSAQVHRIRARSVYICTPNNPTGANVPIRDIAALAHDSPATTFIVDQSFLSLSDSWSDAHEPVPDNVVLLRSLTKDHAIPGLRVGYAVSCPSFIYQLEINRPPWTTSAPAQAAIIASCKRQDFVARARSQLREDRDYLCSGILRLGLSFIKSCAPFLMVRAGSAASLRTRLLTKHQIQIRDCASFGHPEFMRIAVRPRHDLDRLIEALATEIDE